MCAALYLGYRVNRYDQQELYFTAEVAVPVGQSCEGLSALDATEDTNDTGPQQHQSGWVRRIWIDGAHAVSVLAARGRFTVTVQAQRMLMPVRRLHACLYTGRSLVGEWEALRPVPCRWHEHGEVARPYARL